MLKVTIPNHIIHISQINNTTNDINNVKLSDITNVLSIKSIQTCDSITVTDGNFGYILKSNINNLKSNTLKRISEISDIIELNKREFTFY